MTQPTAILFTIGYAGANIGNFIDTLRAAGVEELVDVRAVASSRNRPFAKNALATALAEAGIAYRHLKALGTPKAGRDAARRGDAATMHHVYDGQLATPEAQDALAALRALASEKRVAVMCMESDPAQCHRSIVAARLGADFMTEHLHPASVAD